MHNLQGTSFQQDTATFCVPPGAHAAKTAIPKHTNTTLSRPTTAKDNEPRKQEKKAGAPQSKPTVHLHKQLRLDATAGFMLRVRPSLGADGVDLINEDGGGSVEMSLQQEDSRTMSFNHTTNWTRAQHAQERIKCCTSQSYLQGIIGRSCHEYNFCCDKHVFAATKVLSRQARLSQQIFVVTKVLSQQKYVFMTNMNVFATKLLSRQAYFCCDKRGVLLQQPHVWYLWQLPPTIHGTHAYNFNKCKASTLYFPSVWSKHTSKKRKRTLIPIG